MNPLDRLLEKLDAFLLNKHRQPVLRPRTPQERSRSAWDRLRQALRRNVGQ